jgi:hypothetical protein
MEKSGLLGFLAKERYPQIPTHGCLLRNSGMELAKPVTIPQRPTQAL